VVEKEVSQTNLFFFLLLFPPPHCIPPRHSALKKRAHSFLRPSLLLLIPLCLSLIHSFQTVMPGTYLLDYGAGNVRSLVNAVKKLGHDITYVKDPSDILKADVSKAPMAE